eukprot:354393-Chlamydomonas_euryale.AAC.1
MCNKAPKRTPELQGSGFKAPMTSTPRGGGSPRRLGGREWLRQVTTGNDRVAPVTPPSYAIRQLCHTY